MGQRYFIANAAMPTTAAAVKVTTGTSLKTMLQLQTSSGNPIWVESWGISFDGTAAATPIQCELIETGSVAATVTAHSSTGVMNLDMVSDGGTSTLTLGTSATGFTSTAEGSVTATRLFDLQQVAPTSGYVREFAIDRMPLVPPSRNLRIRVTAGAAVNAYCWIIFND